MLFEMKTKKNHKPRRAENNERPPTHLSGLAKTIWKDVIAEFELSSENLQLLRIALENMDLADNARALLRAEGLITAEGKKHPASDAVKLHDGLYMRAMRQLGLDVTKPGSAQGAR